MDEFSVSFVIPVTNETQSLRKTVEGIFEHCLESDIAEILIVRSKTASDGCRHTSAELKKQYPQQVVDFEQTRPYMGGAIHDGFDCVTSSHWILLPGDNAIELEYVAKLIEREKEMPTGIVKTSRWIERNSFSGYSPVRKVFNRCAQSFLRVLYHTRLTDMTNPIQIMPTVLYRRMVWTEMNVPVLIEMILCPLRLGVEFREIPAVIYGRTEGKSNNSILQTALYFKTALSIRFTKPEKLLDSTERLAQ